MAEDISIGIALDGVSKYNSDLDKVEGKTNKSTGGMKGALKGFAVAAAAAFSVDAMIGFGKEAVNLAMKLEQDTVAFETMLGSAEAAQEQLKGLEEFAKATPFQLDGLIEADKLLINFGRTAEQSMDDLKILGDISGGNEERFKSLSLVFGQVSSAGKLMGQDLLQLINAGFNPLQVMSEKSGKSVAELKDEMSKGNISFDDMRQAMVAATSEGGKFFNMMEKQSQTTAGRISTLKDNFAAIQREIGQRLLPVISSLVDWLQKNIKTFKEIIDLTIDGIVNAYKPFYNIVKDIMGIFEELGDVFGDTIDVADILNGVFKVAKWSIEIMLKPIKDVIAAYQTVISLTKSAGKFFGLISKRSENFGSAMAENVKLMGGQNAAMHELMKVTGASQKELQSFVKTLDLNALAVLPYNEAVVKITQSWEKFNKKPAKEAAKNITDIGAATGKAKKKIKDLGIDTIKAKDIFVPFSTVINGTRIVVDNTTKSIVDGYTPAINEAARANQQMGSVIDEQVNKVGFLQLAWDGLSDNLRDIAKNVLPELKSIGIDALAGLAQGLGMAIAGGATVREVFNKFLQDLFVQIPKLVGMAMLNQAAATPSPASLPLAIGGLALLGLSGLAQGLLSGGGGNNTGVDAGGVGAAAIGGGGASGLSDFQSSEGTMLDLQGAFDGAEITFRTEDGSFRTTVEKSIMKNKRLRGK